MALYKNPKLDLRGKWKRIFELSLIFAISLLIIAFKFYPRFEKEQTEIAVIEEELKVEDIVNTKQENRPPPPPKPPILIEAPSDQALDDIDVSDLELDINEVVDTPPPPPTKKEVEVEAEPEFFQAVEEMPEPVGGIGAIQEKIVYPELAKRAGVQGKVHIKAFVDENGNVTKTELIKGIGAGCDEEAMKAVKATKFKPGKQRMKPVKVQVTVPVVFRLQS